MSNGTIVKFLHNKTKEINTTFSIDLNVYFNPNLSVYFVRFGTQNFNTIEHLQERDSFNR